MFFITGLIVGFLSGTACVLALLLFAAAYAKSNEGVAVEGSAKRMDNDILSRMRMEAAILTAQTWLKIIADRDGVDPQSAKTALKALTRINEALGLSTPLDGIVIGNKVEGK